MTSAHAAVALVLFASTRNESGGGGPSPNLIVLDGPVTASGPLSTDAIRRVVHERFGLFRACYEQQWQRDPTLQCRVAIDFAVDARGAVTGATDAGSSGTSPALRACVRRGFTALRFPPPAAVTVSYTLVFRHP